MGKSKIEWCDTVWNPITGCSPVSEGCLNCWAKRMARRLAGRYGYPESPNEFDVTWHPDRMQQVYTWRKPRRVFVCSMSDLFHADVPKLAMNRVFWNMKSPQNRHHTFMVLTKRPKRMAERVAEAVEWEEWGAGPDNIELGVTIENQKRADERISILLQIPAAVRFVSIEPMLGPVGLGNIQLDSQTRYNALEGCGTTSRGVGGQMSPNVHGSSLDWVVVGAETGPGARPMDPDWARGVRDQCVEAGVPFFYKRGSNGSRLLDGRMWEEYPKEAVND